MKLLQKEIRGYAKQAEQFQVKTIFFGGGTPSLLSAEQMGEIFAQIQESFSVEKEAEITIEANPGSVSEEILLGYHRLGVNRISFGVQSMNEEELRLLGRIHTKQEVKESLVMARRAGFANLNVDLMFGLPGQKEESLRQTVHEILAMPLPPEHISAYSLSLEEGTLFYERYHRQSQLLPDEETERRMYWKMAELLKQAGYRRYEISNYAKDGYECRHNLGYWSDMFYLGVGLGAASYINGVRFLHTKDPLSYKQAIETAAREAVVNRTLEWQGMVEEREVLSKERHIEEALFLGLRKVGGVSAKEFFHRFNETLEEWYGPVLRRLQQEGLLEKQGDWYRLTEYGTDVSNYVFEKFLL